MSRSSKKATPRRAAAAESPGLAERLERHLRFSDPAFDAPAEPPSRASRIRRAAALTLIVLCCLITRLSATRTLDVDNDESTYTTGVGFQYAEYIRSGDLMGILQCRENYEHPPLVKLIYGAAVAATGQDRTPEQVIAVCRVVAVLFACLAAVLLFFLSPWAALLFSIHSWEIYYSSKGWLDSITVFFTVAAFYFFLRAGRKWNRSMAASAFFIGAGVASKYVNGLFAITLFPFLVFFFRKRPRWILAYVGISILTFLVLDPALWLDPIGNFRASVAFHRVQSGTALYQRFLDRYGGDTGMLGQFLSLWGNTARYQPDRLAFGFDRLILLLGLAGLPFLLRRNAVLFAWFLSAGLFLLFYPIKYPHYSMVFIPALALSAAEALRSGLPWALSRIPADKIPIDRARLPRLPAFLGERELAALAAAAATAWAAVFAFQHWNTGKDSLRAYNSFAYTLTRLGRNEEAQALFAKSGQGGGELGVAAHLNMADILLRQQKTAEARAELAQVFRTNPDSAEGHALLGNSWLQEDRLDQAMEEYRKVDTKRLPDPNALSSLWVNMASIQMKKKEFDSCRELLEKAVQLVPKNGDAHYLLGLTYFTQGDLAGAEREIVLATGNGVAGWKVFHDLGIVYAQQKRYAEAIASWEKALRFDPQNAETRKYVESARRLVR